MLLTLICRNEINLAKRKYTLPWVELKHMINCFARENLRKKTVKINVDSWSEYESLKQHGLFNLTGKPLKIVDRLSMLVHNIQSLSKHCKGIMRDKGHK